MEKNDDALITPGDILAALMLLTRLPVPGISDPRGARAAWAYPVAGLIVGALGALAGLIAHASGLPAPLCALAALLTLIFITGALHEDGLADTADGLWGGSTPERRLEIMKDSRTGAYGVIALFFGLSARWAALWMLFEASPTVALAAILVASTASRAVMAPVMAALPRAREGGLSAHVGHVPASTALIACGIALLITIFFGGWAGVAAFLWAGVVTVLIARIALNKIGGQTGDILGATQQLAEIAILFSLIA